MRYKLIHKKTNQETICEKVVVDGYDYYVSDTEILFNDFYFSVVMDKISHYLEITKELTQPNPEDRKVIATSNPSIDISKIVDEVEELAKEVSENEGKWGLDRVRAKINFLLGYNKSQETHPFSEDDMVEFGEYLSVQQDEDGQILNPNYVNDRVLYISAKQLLELWKSQKPKTLYYK